MRREESRTGRIADFEFQFWECWESDDNVPAAPERHWFRSDTDLEAATYDHMLQKLYRQKMGLRVVPQMPSEPQRSATSEWDKRTPCVVQVNGKEVLIEICEHYTEATGGAPVSTKFVGPDGLVTFTYPEMLERLGVAREQQQSALGPPQADISAKQKTPKVSTPVLATADADCEDLVISQDGNLVAHSAQEDLSPVVDDRQQAEVQPAAVSASDPAQSAAGGSMQKQDLQSVVGPSRANPPSLKSDDATDVVVASQNGKSKTGDARALDARDMEEAKTRGEEFETRHPWFWEDPDEELDEPLNSMRLVWWGEYIKAVYPELAAAALDPQKFEAYIDNYDHERPIPLNEPDEQGKRSADAAPRCRFIKADGEQCGSPALRRKRFCYFHSKTAEDRKRKKPRSDASPAAARSVLEMPVLEDDLAIQMAVSNICRQLANETIDPKRAATLLYGMQVAAVAVRRAQNRANLTW